MTIKVGSQDVQAIYVGSTPVQEVYVGSTKIWPVTWYKWTGTYSGITTSYYTPTRNPAVYSNYYDSSHVSQGTIKKVDTSGDDVTAIWTEWDSTTQQGYSYSYDGVAS